MLEIIISINQVEMIELAIVGVMTECYYNKTDKLYTKKAFGV